MHRYLEKIWKYKLDHLILWLAFAIYTGLNLRHLINPGGFSYYVFEVFGRVFLLAFIVYVNFLVLLPLLLNRKKYLFYIVALLPVITIFVYFRNHQDLHIYRDLLEVPGYDYYNSTLQNISGAILFLLFCTALKFSKRFYLQQQLLHQIQLEKLDTELKYLKAQINPHTVFNSINSIFSLIDKSNKNARASLARFSEMLRYQLYESGRDKIEISNELTYLANFIEFQKMRKKDNLAIDFSVSPRVNGFVIAPLLITPFVENAFKHISSREDWENRIEIGLDVLDDLFVLRVYNTYEKHPKQIEILKGGIGLSNVKRRLELLYPQKHDLNISEGGTYYLVTLKLSIV